MADRYRIAITIVVFSVGTVVHLLAGIFAGLQGDWDRMTFFFVVSVLFTVMATGFALARKVEDRFKYIERQLAVSPTRAYTRRDPAVFRMVGAFTISSVFVQLSLGALCAVREAWFAFGILLAACLMTFVICTGLLVSLKIKSHVEYLEREEKGSSI